METNSSPRILPSFDSTILISVVTSFAYLCPFLYQYNYCRTFDIPAALVTVDLSTIMQYWTSALAVVVFACLIGYSLISWTDRTNGRKKVTKFLIIGELVLLLTSVFVRMLTSKDFFSDRLIMYLWLGSSILLIVFALYYKKDIREGYFDLDSEGNAEDEPSEMTVEQRTKYLNQKLRSAVYSALIMLTLFCLTVTYIKGGSDAENEENFYVLKKRPEVVVLKFYEDRIICREFDYKKPGLKKSLIIVKLDESSPLELELKSIGTIGSKMPSYIFKIKSSNENPMSKKAKFQNDSVAIPIKSKKTIDSQNKKLKAEASIKKKNPAA